MNYEVCENDDEKKCKVHEEGGKKIRKTFSISCLKIIAFF